MELRGWRCWSWSCWEAWGVLVLLGHASLTPGLWPKRRNSTFQVDMGSPLGLIGRATKGGRRQSNNRARALRESRGLSSPEPLTFASLGCSGGEEISITCQKERRGHLPTRQVPVLRKHQFAPIACLLSARRDGQSNGRKHVTANPGKLPSVRNIMIKRHKQGGAVVPSRWMFRPASASELRSNVHCLL